MSPYNIIARKRQNGEVEAAAIDPVASMASIGQPPLTELAPHVREKLGPVISSL